MTKTGRMWVGIRRTMLAAVCVEVLTSILFGADAGRVRRPLLMAASSNDRLITSSTPSSVPPVCRHAIENRETQTGVYVLNMNRHVKIILDIVNVISCGHS
uniref:Uncharacterized protein n=1 Tax=Branchiostoma floridae TaxID=7739 RepID=C3YVB2_BRAFL|eukprot:XP_002599816.1 hypothetical protein BRAFLDRAFT_70287 [Branchiostoma floridae]